MLHATIGVLDAMAQTAEMADVLVSNKLADALMSMLKTCAADYNNYSMLNAGCEVLLALGDKFDKASHKDDFIEAILRDASSRSTLGTNGSASELLESMILAAQADPELPSFFKKTLVKLSECNAPKVTMAVLEAMRSFADARHNCKKLIAAGCFVPVVNLVSCDDKKVRFFVETILIRLNPTKQAPKRGRPADASSADASSAGANKQKSCTAGTDKRTRPSKAAASANKTDATMGTSVEPRNAGE